MFGLCIEKACILIGIIISLLPLLYDISVEAALGYNIDMYHGRTRLGSNTILRVFVPTLLHSTTASICETSYKTAATTVDWLHLLKC